ncbi:MAG: hypothetical protein COY19_05110 [Candidatus Marinimicrobia bacterium CG_4_10_14_0_2_um_filter_48_9]|nr:MAG: hypothetical protein COY19_05110 [Candidatus Marinimicrobia bacterium CG_4_10_14_0_2_um_filter_48_9]
MSIFSLRLSFVIGTMTVVALTGCTKDNAKGDIAMRLEKLHYDNSQGELGVTHFSYNQEGRLESSVWELTDGTRRSKNSHRFDDQGREIQKYREFSDGLTSSNDYEYDAAGRMMVERFSRSDGRTGTTWYEYDSTTGHPTRMVAEGLNGWFHGIVVFVTDSTGRKLRADIVKDGKPYGSIEYGYNETGLLVREHWALEQGEWTQTFTYEYGPVMF